MAQPITSTPLSSGHTTAHAAVFDVKAHFSAAGNGVTDDTAAFTAAANAAGAGGEIFVPQGTFILNNWAPAQQVHIRCAGMPLPGGSGGTTLKAKAGATWVVKLLGQYNPTISDCAIDGNALASGGVLVQGQGAGATSQGAMFENVQFIRCLTGIKLDASIVQADKNTLIRVRMDECTTGLWLNGTNTQFTELVQVVIGADTGVRMSGGTLVWIGGGPTNGSAAPSTGILIDNSNAQAVTLVDIIAETGTASTAIDGSTAWPVNGVALHSCILDGTTANVKMGVNSSVLKAVFCQFNDGDIKTTGDDTTIVDEYCIFALGAVVDDTGVNNRRVSTTNNGTFRYFNNDTTPVASDYITGEKYTLGVSTLVKAGIPVDGDFIFPTTGMMAVDSTNNRLYVRVGATWKYTALT